MNNSGRPQEFNQFIGNEGVKEQLELSIEACKMNNQVFSHTLLYGNPGLGKTTLANIISNTLGYKLFSIVGSSMKNEEDLFVLLFQIAKAQEERPVILFIDEIHSIQGRQELPQTVFFPLLEDFVFYSNLQEKTVTIDGEEYKITANACQLSPFTIIGATTDPSDLDEPLRDRFIHQLFLKPYSEEDLSQIILNYCQKVKVGIEDGASLEIAKRARFTPRIALSYLKSCYDMATVKNGGRITREVIAWQMKLMGIDGIGLKEEDIKILQALRDAEKGLGIAALAGITGIAKKIILGMSEPFLQQKKFIMTTNKRQITSNGLAYLEGK